MLPEISRELAVGARQQWREEELALELLLPTTIV